MSNNNTLKKSVTTVEAMALVVGMIIGSGVFLKPGVVLSNAGTPIMSIMAWVAGGIITLAALVNAALYFRRRFFTENGLPKMTKGGK